MNKKFWIFIILFSGMNLIFIPLLSLYGLRACPVLSVPGFGFGCYYAGIFVLISNFCNLCFLLLNFHKKETFIHKVLHKIGSLFWLSLFSYFFGTVVALVFLNYLLEVNHLTTVSRAPEILGLASLLLGITQTYGLSWALNSAESDSESVNSNNFSTKWLGHIIRILSPFAIFTAILVHFLFSQSVEFNEGRIAPNVSNDELIYHTTYLVLTLTGWLVFTFAFYFLAERDQVLKIQGHFQKLSQLDFSYRSNTQGSWGLWSSLISQLNLFSKALGERARLLKTFSRFVTAGVAESALYHDLNETKGLNQELTVMMSDIRNFTGLSESLSPHQVVTLLNEYFSAMLDVISNFPISVDKFIGDGILAYVESGDTQPAQENMIAVRSAIAMIEKLKPLNQKLDELQLPEVSIGIGIYRGPLVIGLIGSEAKLQHTIIGDTVNRTARLESLCKDLGVSIVISEEIFASLDSTLQNKFKEFGKKTVKGIAQPIGVYGGPQEQVHKN